MEIVVKEFQVLGNLALNQSTVFSVVKDRGVVGKQACCPLEFQLPDVVNEEQKQNRSKVASLRDASYNRAERTAYLSERYKLESVRQITLNNCLGYTSYAVGFQFFQ